MANDNGDNSRAARRSDGRKNPRLRLACLRCQRRKIKCDGDVPTCKNCRNAGATCADGESARLKDLPRAYIVGLKRRILWLESIVSSRCPDVDLSQGLPPDEAEETFDDADTSLALTNFSPNGNPPHDMPTAASNPLTSTPQEPTRSGPEPPSGEANALTHEIGLVSLVTNQDPRYIGPSSGYFLARVMLDSSASRLDASDPRHPARDAPFPTQLVEAIQAPLPLPSRDMARQLADAYFSVIHPQFPVLHRPTWLRMLEQAYAPGETDPVVGFHVFMVLALGAMVLSARLRARVPGESYCLSALEYYPGLNLENSIQGVQCLLLLLIFTMHNPYVRLNVWYLNYHCLAALLDLGLQRNIGTRSGISLLEQEMRARIFWVIFSFDRILATMMGRPIGIRDEACELRMPEGLSDDDLSRHTSLPSPLPPSKDMRFAMHLFRAAKLNSEIKYVANSINRSAPSYAYPPVRDMATWQSDMLGRLDEWAAQIPAASSDDPSDQYLAATCRLRHHGLRMLLLRPSPAIPKPSASALDVCHVSACESLRLFDQLYSANLLVHSWVTFHSLVLSTMTMLFCIKASADVARRTDVDDLMGLLSVALSVLSATGEHWSGAKRSRDILDRLGRATIRWLRGLSSNGEYRGSFNLQTPIVPGAALPLTVDSAVGLDGVAGFVQNPFEDLLGNDSFAGYFEASESGNVDTIVRDLFQDFIPMYPTFA